GLRFVSRGQRRREGTRQQRQRYRIAAFQLQFDLADRRLIATRGNHAAIQREFDLAVRRENRERTSLYARFEDWSQLSLQVLKLQWRQHAPRCLQIGRVPIDLTFAFTADEGRDRLALDGLDALASLPAHPQGKTALL